MKDILARTLWGEARSEGFLGMKAVANVIVNRADRPSWWGRDIESVCRKKWQFSCWNENDPNLPKLLTVTDADPQFQIALHIASLVNNDALEDITNGATHYFVKNMKKPPAWAEGKKPCAEIGAHVFYKDV